MKNYVFVIERGDKRMNFLMEMLRCEGAAAIDFAEYKAQYANQSAVPKNTNSPAAKSTNAGLIKSTNTGASTDNENGISFLGYPVPVFCYSPARKFKLKELSALPEGAIIACGRLSFEQIMLLAEHKVRHINLIADDTFTVQNSMLTAEAALSILIANTDGSIFSDKILIVGLGRLGKSLAKLFSMLGIDFAVCTASALERAEAKLFTDKTYTADAPLLFYDAILNTVPAEILPKEALLEIPPSCLFMELASTPAINAETLSALNIRYLNCPSLPGKLCPKAAGDILKGALLKHL